MYGRSSLGLTCPEGNRVVEPTERWIPSAGGKKTSEIVPDGNFANTSSIRPNRG